MVLRSVWLVALRLDGVVVQKVAPELLPCIGNAGRLVFSLFRRGPAARWDGVPKVGVVFQKVVPESPLCILLTWYVASPYLKVTCQFSVRISDNSSCNTTVVCPGASYLIYGSQLETV